ncbi:chalcone isomerase family protein [Limnobacter litoralis]|uniref:Chalcone isomerase domain-containing protein n=1 Tax=Limnobacter litoralis TaxID=481366 RepID=A0ABQ5YM87_9BURK|nr:chalcone isomerase family protein [Limnobacter litoralis]GLR25704.1 hypothetical protein GCM10007875_07920 [Limnobacter litoralis]
MVKRLKTKAWLTMLVCLLTGPGFVSSALAVDVDGLQLPDTYTFDGHTYALNGAGTRYYSLFKIRVYSAGLYLRERTHDAAAILSSTETRIVHLEMRVDSKREDNQKAWTHYLRANCEAPCVLNSNSLDQFMQIQTNLHTGDTETYVFDAKGLSILRNDKPVQTIADPQFARTVLSSWIGRVPSTESLKVQLLGSK